MRTRNFDLCVVGGCGHVGLPLALTFARAGSNVAIYDIDQSSIDLLRSKQMPFKEEGAQEVLEQVIGRNLEVGSDPELISRSDVIVVVIGTPVDEHLNPKFHEMKMFMQGLIPRLRDGQLIILRSTVFPGVSRKVQAELEKNDAKLDLAFCPERVAEGKAMTELISLPQIVSGFSDSAVARARELFESIGCRTLTMTPEEAELTKIFTNSWRYIQFATANQFFMIATELGLEYYKIFEAMTFGYPRMMGLPKSGFAAGPCLFKDTMQLAAVASNRFALGHSAMLVNEGLPDFIVKQIKQNCDISAKRVGVLGMAFKAESDDKRESLSYKLRKILEYEAAGVLCHDPYVRDESLGRLEDVLDCDLIVLGAPHACYRGLIFRPECQVIDVWNFFDKGANIIAVGTLSENDRSLRNSRP